MNAVTPFAYGDQVVRVVERHDETCFVAADVCRVLELSNVTKALDHLDLDERDVVDVQLSGPLTSSKGASDANDGDAGLINGRTLNIISEPGLYALVMRSRKPEARKFDRWVRHEVLPAIRKTGSYARPQPPVEDDELDRFGSVNIISIKLRMVSLTSRLHGSGAARRMWEELELPAVDAEAEETLADIVLARINDAGVISHPELYRGLKRRGVTPSRLLHVLDALSSEQRIRIERIATGRRPRTIYHAVEI